MNLFFSMKVFVKIVDKGSFTAAAKSLELSPAMVGNYLQSLENHLAIKLIHRTTRQQSLTDFGFEYYDRCIAILSLVTDAESAAHGKDALPSGTLKVTAPNSFGAEALIPALSQFGKHYPEVNIDLVLSDHHFDLFEDDIDIAVRIGTLPDSNLIAQTLSQYKMVVCASPAYLLEHGTPHQPEQLSQHSCVLFSAFRAKWTFHKKGIASSVEVTGKLKVNSGQALRKAALNHLGIIMQPHVLLDDHIKNGSLIELFTGYELPSKEINLMYLKDRYMPPKIRCFVDFMMRYFAT